MNVEGSQNPIVVRLVQTKDEIIPEMMKKYGLPNMSGFVGPVIR